MAQITILGYPVSLFLYDFDGIMTDNKVLVGEDGQESVVCNRSDGLAVSIIKKWGIPQAIISTETNKVVAARSKKLEIPFIYGVSNKKETVLEYCRELDISPQETLYIGNDLNDREAMLSVGYPVCPKDAYKEIQEIAKLILPIDGGSGVIRELLNFLNTKLHKHI
jgi:3-deoxy-D-manno-octulosonate 8-phosphate phosphatase (KDO 8-P phosphatase)